MRAIAPLPRGRGGPTLEPHHPALPLRALLLFAPLFTVSACDTGAEPDALPYEGFAPASRHLFLEDSTGATTVAGYTLQTRTPELGDTTRGTFRFVLPEGLGDGDVVATCTDVEGEPESLHPDALTYRLTAPDGRLWTLRAACDAPGEGVWERIEGDDAVEGGTFTSAIAVE